MISFEKEHFLILRCELYYFNDCKFVLVDSLDLMKRKLVDLRKNQQNSIEKYNFSTWHPESVLYWETNGTYCKFGNRSTNKIIRYFM